jgi:hypothetical protein
MKRLLAALFILSLLWIAPSARAQVPPVPDIPEQLLVPGAREHLETLRSGLVQRLAALESHSASFNSKCARVETGSALYNECANEQPSVVAERQAYIDRVNAFKDLLSRAQDQNARCVELRQKLAHTRAALQTQKKADLLVAEASSEQVRTIEARSGMVAAKLAKLATRFSEVDTICYDVTEVLADEDNRKALGLAAGTSSFTLMAQTWKALKPYQSAKDCHEQFITTNGESSITKITLAAGQCAGFLKDTFEFSKQYSKTLRQAEKILQGEVGKKALSKLGGQFDIALTAADLANEVNETYEAVQSFDDYTSKIPNDSLEATKSLGELSKKQLREAEECESSLARMVNQAAE